MNVTGQAEIFWLENLVGRWVGKNGLGVNTSLVGESAETGNVVVEGNGNLYSVGDEVLDFS